MATQTPGLETILLALHNYLLRNFGVHAQSVRVDCMGKAKFVLPIPVPMPHIPAYPLSGAEPAPSPGDTASGTAAALAILTILEETGHRMTKTRLLFEINRRKMNHSPAVVHEQLAAMVADGTLTLDPGARPAGYGPAEWSERPAGS